MGRGTGVLRPRWGQDVGGNGGINGAPREAAPPGTPTSTTTERADAIALSGALAIQFGYANLAASQTQLQAYQVIPGSSTNVAQLPDQQMFRGSVLGLKIRSNAPITAGSATFDVLIEDEAQTLGFVWTVGDRDYLTFAKGQYPFLAGEDIIPIVTTDSSFAPTTNDIIVTLFVSYEPE